MGSLLVNASAKAALRTLSTVRRESDDVRAELNTGLKIRGAKDNAAFFLVAAETRSDVVITKGVRDNLVAVDSALTVAFTGISNIRKSLDNIRDAIVAGETAGYDNGLDKVIRGQIETVRDVIRATSSADQNFLAEGGDQTIITNVRDEVGKGFKVDTLTVRSLELDRRDASLTEGLEIVPAQQTFDLRSGGSVVRFGGRYKVTSLTNANVARTGAAFNAYRLGPATTDPAPRIVHPTGSEKQWLLSDFSDDFRTRRGSGNSVFGGAGNDRLVSGTNDSVLVGGDGDDLIVGGRTGDRIWGDAGNDFLRVTRNGSSAVGGEGNDTLRGGNGGEIFFGGLGNDNIASGRGNDIIIGGAGDDVINGGNGADLIYEGDNSGSDLIRLAGGGGTVFYESSASQYTINVINGNRFLVTDNRTGDVDDIRNGTPADLVFDVAPPDQPDYPVTADFFESLTIDYSALTDPVSGEAVRQSLSFMALVDFLDPDTSGYSMAGALQVLDTALQKLNFGESQLGSYQTSIRRQMEVSDGLTDRLEEGVAALVEADLAETSARLAAVQAREEIALQGLGISGQRPSLLLSLFR
ncbi:hypothetical protein HK107_04305 [Parvularcula sp. ZS-1/3]|uniref:Flagellin n=1 Tax=Parvularcula mediterranea TaxID=2732508 RepID=A0A7Y3RK39_9PROT|nr:flagellin [Parvularcula mediterranea]NNU15539.1 hypothetical protein [Parvularcula mediterranea]